MGSEEKIEYLTSVFGIPRDHIFNSSDGSFLQGILKASYSRCVDVILNSPSGELLHESWNCVARFGAMVEIGKRDFIGKAELAMDRFENNRTFGTSTTRSFGRTNLRWQAESRTRSWSSAGKAKLGPSDGSRHLRLEELRRRSGTCKRASIYARSSSRSQRAEQPMRPRQNRRAESGFFEMTDPTCL